MVLGFLFRKKKSKPAKKRTEKKAKVQKRKTISKPKTKAKKTIIKKRTVRKIISKKEKNIQKIGRVTHYFPKVKAAVIKITKGPLRLGDTVYLKGHTTDFKQKVASMQIEHKLIKLAKRGDLIGLRVRQRTREGDIAFKEF